MDWRGVCMLSLYKGKGDKCECSNCRGISLLSVVGKLFGRVLIKKVWAGTECVIGEEPELCALVNKPSGASAGASDLKY